MIEHGYPELRLGSWIGIFVDKQTPPAIVKRLHADAVAVIKSQEMVDQLLVQGAEAVGNTPQELETFLRADIERWTKVIKQAQIRVD